MCNLLGSQVQAIIIYPKLAKEFSKSALLCSELAKSKENAVTAKVPWPQFLIKMHGVWLGRGSRETLSTVCAATHLKYKYLNTNPFLDSNSRDAVHTNLEF